MTNPNEARAGVPVSGIEQDLLDIAQSVIEIPACRTATISAVMMERLLSHPDLMPHANIFRISHSQSGGQIVDSFCDKPIIRQSAKARPHDRFIPFHPRSARRR